MTSRHGLAWLVGCLALLGASRAEATEVGRSRDFGLGLALGTSTSLVGKYFLDPGSALDFGVSFARWRRGCVYDYRRNAQYCHRYGDAYGHGGFGLHGDYLWQDNLVQRRAKLDWHIGVGARMWRWDADDYYYYHPDYRGDRTFSLAARMPIGLDLSFARPNFLEVYFEIVPSLVLVPVVDLDFEGYVGVRFFF